MSDVATMDLRGMTWKEVGQLVRLSRAQVRTLEEKGQFPQRIRVGERRTVWLEDEVKDWLETKRVR